VRCTHLVLVELFHLEALRPGLLVEVQQHLLLELGVPVADVDRVVVSVQPVDQRLERRLVEVPDVGGRLPRLLSDLRADVKVILTPPCISYIENHEWQMQGGVG
jgi:hypothetical protein